MAILAGGMASRLGTLSERRPKALVPVCGTPFIDHQLGLVRQQGISDVVLCVGRLGEMIRSHVGDGARHGLRIRYSFDGDTPLGTGGALRAALPLLDDRFFVEYGDTYLRAPLAEVAAAFEGSDAPALMTVYRNENRLERSNVDFDGGTIRAYDKRAPAAAMRYIDFGLLVFKKDAVSGLPATGEHDLAELLQSLVARGELAGFEVPERFYEIGTPEALAETERLLEPILSAVHATRA